MKRDLKEHKFKVRDILKDDVAEFEGVVMAIAEQISGCIHYGLCPVRLSKEGVQQNWGWFDTSRLKRVSGSGNKKRVTGYVPESWDQKYNLRDVLKDEITGFEGTVVSINFYATGCVTYEMIPKKLDRDGKVLDTENIGQERLKLVRAYKKPESKSEPMQITSPPCEPGSKSSSCMG